MHTEKSKVKEVHYSEFNGDWLLVYESEAAVCALHPNFDRMLEEFPLNTPYINSVNDAGYSYASPKRKRSIQVNANPMR